MHIMSPSPVSLFEQLGGQAAVEAAVDNFYRKVLTDDRVSSFFEDVDMDRQRAKQKAFLTMAFGGPHNYSGKDMRAAHARLVLEDGIAKRDYRLVQGCVLVISVTYIVANSLTDFVYRKLDPRIRLS